MNNAQGAITAAYAVIGGTGLIAFDWWGTIKQKIQTPAAGKTGSAPAAPAAKVSDGSSSVNAFEAYIASYVIFMIAGESDTIGPISAALAWAFAIGMAVANFSAYETRFPSLFGQSAGSVPTAGTNKQPGG